MRFWGLTALFFRIGAARWFGAKVNDLLTNQAREAQNRALDALGGQAHRGQIGDRLRGHALLVVQPENETVAVLIRSGGARTQALVDLLEQDFAFHRRLPAQALGLPSGVNFFQRFLVLSAAALLRMDRLKVVAGHIDA